MKVKLDEEVVLEIDEAMLKLLAHDLEDPVEDIKRRLAYIIEHKAEQCYSRMKKEWIEKFMDDSSVPSIPADRKQFVELVTSQSTYKNRKQKELEAKR